jgi:hypothetical protein
MIKEKLLAPGKKEPTKSEIAALVLLVFKNKGPKQFIFQSKEDGKKVIIIENIPDNAICKELSQEQLLLYKIIFDTNNSDLREKFFNDEFIRRVWKLSLGAPSDNFFVHLHHRDNL